VVQDVDDDDTQYSEVFNIERAAQQKSAARPKRKEKKDAKDKVEETTSMEEMLE